MKAKAVTPQSPTAPLLSEAEKAARVRPKNSDFFYFNVFAIVVSFVLSFVSAVPSDFKPVVPNAVFAFADVVESLPFNTAFAIDVKLLIFVV